MTEIDREKLSYVQRLEFDHKKLSKSRAELAVAYDTLEFEHKALKREFERLKLISVSLMVGLEHFREGATRLHELASREDTTESQWVPQAMQFVEQMAEVFQKASAAVAPATPAQPPVAPKLRVSLRKEGSEEPEIRIVTTAEFDELLETESTRILNVVVETPEKAKQTG